ncbi:LAME_0A00958g1_1 [Lachancea meyersii CBS 8951]|uniref:LAME_0A00958g1_1 n=1 Tax=Lachancea meyersii CBS 8951 TaxID=1266667 RepID=A0A1G4ILE2_9SACH|nr:LAME_0A00958g1_1 [Lachancea meyersii CBS 8951]
MLFAQIAVTALLSVTGALGLTLKQPHVAFLSSEKRPVALSPVSQNYEKAVRPLVIDRANETLEFSFSLETENRPEQAVFLLGSVPRSAEISFEPIIKTQQNGFTYRFKVPVEKLPEPLLYLALESQELLTATLVLANTNGGSDNLFVELFDLKLDFEAGKELSWPARLESQPEITHLFKGTPKTAPAWITSSTSMVVGACFAVLLVAWMSMGMFSAVSLPLSSSKTLYVLAFIACIVGMEYVFVQYYLGASIFVTLEHAFYVCLGGLFSGAKLLQSFSQ